jgi:hypothetical protein
MQREEMAIARQRQPKHVSAATNQHATTEELLEKLFSMLFVLGLYNENQQD